MSAEARMNPTPRIARRSMLAGAPANIRESGSLKPLRKALPRSVSLEDLRRAQSKYDPGSPQYSFLGATAAHLGGGPVPARPLEYVAEPAAGAEWLEERPKEAHRDEDRSEAAALTGILFFAGILPGFIAGMITAGVSQSAELGVAITFAPAAPAAVSFAVAGLYHARSVRRSRYNAQLGLGPPLPPRQAEV